MSGDRPEPTRAGPVTITSQGSFAVGGTVTTRDGSFNAGDPMNPAGQTLHGDHARVSFHIPIDARPLPLLFWHGWWEDSSCWDTTPDGREGFRTLFLRRRFAVYLSDRPRRGSAGKTTVATAAPAEPVAGSTQPSSGMFSMSANTNAASNWPARTRSRFCTVLRTLGGLEDDPGFA